MHVISGLETLSKAACEAEREGRERLDLSVSTSAQEAEEASTFRGLFDGFSERVGGIDEELQNGIFEALGRWVLGRTISEEGFERGDGGGRAQVLSGGGERAQAGVDIEAALCGLVHHAIEDIDAGGGDAGQLVQHLEEGVELIGLLCERQEVLQDAGARERFCEFVEERDARFDVHVLLLPLCGLVIEEFYRSAAHGFSFGGERFETVDALLNIGQLTLDATQQRRDGVIWRRRIRTGWWRSGHRAPRGSERHGSFSRAEV